jgi:hypothetical protein
MKHNGMDTTKLKVCNWIHGVPCVFYWYLWYRLCVFMGMAVAQCLVFVVHTMCIHGDGCCTVFSICGTHYVYSWGWLLHSV